MARGKQFWTVSHVGDPGADGPVRKLTSGDIGVVFQPIVNVASGRLFAHEALVRCKRPELTPPPVLFEHAVAEKTCGRLGRLIRDVAFATCGDVALFVNLHPEELESRWLVRTDDPICFHPKAVYLEITESASLTYFDLCMSVLKEVCSRTSAKLVIDDFGAGYSNLDRLAQLEPAVVKLDLALTRDIHQLPRKQAIVRHMVSLCTELGATVVAEGVEKLEELACVRDLGVAYAQGYLLARPASPPPPHLWPFRARPSMSMKSVSPAAAKSVPPRASAKSLPPSVRAVPPRAGVKSVPPSGRSKPPPK